MVLPASFLKIRASIDADPANALAAVATGKIASTKINTINDDSLYIVRLIIGSNAKIISLIARDENLHLAVSQNMINNYRNKEGDKEMLKIIKENEQEVYKMYDEAVQQEKDWATYLFQKGSMIGLSEKLLHQYVEYIANRRMRVIGLEQKYEHSSSQNPLPWTQHWFNSHSLQNAPQETEIESYVIGGIKQDVKKDQFKKFKL